MKNIILLIIILVSSANLDAQSWQQLNDLPFEKEGFITCTYNGKGYFIQGARLVGNFINEVWEYDPESGIWTQLDSDILPLMSESIGVAIDNKFYVNTGLSPGIDGFYVYDLLTQTATQLSSPPEISRRGVMQVFGDVIFAGGGIHNTWMMYDIANDIWTAKTPTPITSDHIHLGYSFVVGEYIYLGGGHKDDWLRYHVSTDTWSSINNEAGARHGGNAHLHNNKGYIIGGDRDGHQAITNQDQLNLSFMEYDPIADSWRSLPNIPELPRFLPGSFIIDNVLFYFGGEDATSDSGSLLRSFYKYDLTTLPVGINGFTSKVEDLILSPNPATEILNIDKSLDLSSGNNFYTIHDMLGNKIHEGIISKNQVRLTALPVGNYVLTIRTADKVYGSSFAKVK